MAQDVYTRLDDLDEATVQGIANVLEIRGRHPQQVAIRAAYLDALGDISDQQVLEIGCGTGPVARDLAARVGPGGRVTGTDPSRALIDVAERIKVEQGIENLTFAVQDGRSLPYPDGTFDLTVAVTVLCHLPDREAVLREMARVTRPNGTVLIVDGEYAANQVQHPDPKVTERVVQGWRAGSIDDPYLMRRIVGFVRAAGLEPGAINGYVHVEAGRVDEATSFIWQWSLYAARTAVASEAISQAEADRWIDGLRELNQRSELFGSVTYIGIAAHRP